MPEGCPFESRMRWIFSIYLILPAAPWAEDRLNFWQKWVPGIFRRVKCARRIELTTMPPYASWMSENVGASTSYNSKGLHDPYRDSFTLPLLIFHDSFVLIVFFFFVILVQYIVTCYLLPRRIIRGLRILYLNLLDIHQAELHLLITLPISYHTNQLLLLVLILEELLCRTLVTNSLADCYDNQPLLLL
jgi:hypothetical protein